MGSQTRMELDHRGYPVDEAYSLDSGWKGHYLDPLASSCRRPIAGPSRNPWAQLPSAAAYLSCSGASPSLWMNTVQRGSEVTLLNTGSTLTRMTPGSRCLFARSSHSKVRSASPRKA